MPRYTYECTKCEHSYEKLEGWDAKPRQRCPKCRAVSQRIPMAPMIVFKGSGFYSTDNKRSLRQDSNGSDDGGSDQGGSEGGGSEGGESSGDSDSDGSGSSASDSDGGGDSAEAPKKVSNSESKSGSKSGKR